ncbi:MAG: PIN domain-containing protein [Terracidiphilus sp.]
MNRIVLDASVVLAMILHEPGGHKVDTLLDSLERGANTQVAMSSVNFCEVLTRLEREDMGISAARLAAALSGVDFISFDTQGAEIAASFVKASKALSLGDRACLGLASSLKARAWTTERLWTKCKLEVTVELIRA